MLLPVIFNNLNKSGYSIYDFDYCVEELFSNAFYAHFKHRLKQYSLIIYFDVSLFLTKLVIFS